MTKTETVSAERLTALRQKLIDGADLTVREEEEIFAALTELLASRTQSPAEWEKISERIAVELSEGKEFPTREFMYDIAKEAAELALRAASIPVPETGVRVKPLEWGFEYWEKHQEIYALALFGEYDIRASGGQWLLRLNGIVGGDQETQELGLFGSVEKAMVAAQADNEQHIRSALQTPAPERSKEETSFGVDAAEDEVRKLLHPKKEPDENGFIIGEPVEKFTGEARWEGVLVASYLTTKGQRRYVVEVKPQGFQMIAVPAQLRMIATLETPPLHKEGEAVAWACTTCNSPRSVDPCPKCGTALTEPADGWEWPGLPDIDRIRELAREVGYAIGVHGSLERDLDLIAAPWAADAVGPMELAEHIAAGMGGQVLDWKNQDKPCGRWSCNINTEGWTKMIDLSVMPPAPVPVTITDEMVKRLADELWAHLDLNGHTGDGVRKVARVGLAAALSQKPGEQG